MNRTRATLATLASFVVLPLLLTGCFGPSDADVASENLSKAAEQFEIPRHIVGLSDNVTFVVEQLEPTSVSTTRYRVIFKPETLIPNIDRP